jgi:hypothetical protein
MKSGSKSGEYKWVETTFPLFAANPLYTTTVFTPQQIAWHVTFDLTTEKIDPDWVEVAIKLVLTLRKKDDNKKIAELITTSYYEMHTGLTIEEKMKMVRHTLNQTTGHMQGGWAIKTQNITAGALIPQAYDKVQDHTEQLRKTIKQRWGEWSGK